MKKNILTVAWNQVNLLRFFEICSSQSPNVLLHSYNSESKTCLRMQNSFSNKQGFFHSFRGKNIDFYFEVRKKYFCTNYRSNGYRPVITQLLTVLWDCCVTGTARFMVFYGLLFHFSRNSKSFICTPFNGVLWTSSMALEPCGAHSKRGYIESLLSRSVWLLSTFPEKTGLVFGKSKWLQVLAILGIFSGKEQKVLQFPASNSIIPYLVEWPIMLFFFWKNVS